MLQKPTIYIVDSQPRACNAIARLVKPLRANVETFSRAEDFLDELRDAGPACLVAEFHLPDMDGFELQTRLVRVGVRIPIIFLSGEATVPMAVAVMKAGAETLLQKPYRIRGLLDEIRQALHKEREVWKRREAEENHEERLDSLTRRERDVLERLADGKTNVQIAEELDLSLRAVEKRRAKALQKLCIESRTELMHLLRVAFPPKTDECPRPKTTPPAAKLNGKRGKKLAAAKPNRKRAKKSGSNRRRS